MNPMPQITFEIQPNTVMISLHKEGGVIENRTLEDTRQLSQTLLPAIDELLSKHQLTYRDLESVAVQSAVPAVYTSYRIVDATAKAIRFAQEHSPS